MQIRIRVMGEGDRELYGALLKTIAREGGRGSPKLPQLDQESKSSNSIVECNLTDVTPTIRCRM